MLKGQRYGEMVNVLSIIRNIYCLIWEAVEELSTSEVD